MRTSTNNLQFPNYHRILNKNLLQFAFCLFLLVFTSVPSFAQHFTEAEIRSNKRIKLHECDSRELLQNVMYLNQKDFQHKSNPTYVHDSTILFSFISPQRNFVPYLKFDHLYEGIKEINIISYFPPDIGDWVENSYEVFHYNEKGQLTEYSEVWINGDYTGFPEEDLIEKSFYHYDEEGRLIEYENQNSYDLDVNRFGERSVFEYDNNGLLVKVYTYDRKLSEEADIEPYYQYFYRYDIVDSQNIESAILINSTRYTYQSPQSNPEWVLSDSSDIFRNNLLKIDSINKYRKGTTSPSIIYGQNQRIYNNDNQVRHEHINRHWDPTDNSWNSIQIRSFNYTAADEIGMITSYDSIPETQEKILDYTTSYEYDETVTSEDIKRHRSLGIPGFSGFVESHPKHMLLELKDLFTFNYEPAGTMWRYYYSKNEVPTSTNQINRSKELSAYPVPSRDKITINIEDIKGDVVLSVYTLSGQKLIHTNYTTGSQLDISHLDSGLYICSIINRGNLMQTRFIKH